MIIAVLSGKGGTGKTFVSSNLASSKGSVVYVDCDVEEPNGALFFKPEIKNKQDVSVRVPVFDDDKCVGCKKCSDFCAFNAIVCIRGKIKLFEDVCHSCGACIKLCDHNAITEKEKVVGSAKEGVSLETIVLSGEMDIGRESGMAIIKTLIDKAKNYKKDIIIDSPPGSGCSVMECVKNADYCILVAEPTEFGKHNLNMVYNLAKVFKKPFGVILNKSIEGIKNPSEDYCKANNIDILSKIPFDKDVIGTPNSEGKIVSRQNKVIREMFSDIFDEVKKKVHKY